VELETKIGGSSLKENIMKVVINKCFGGFELSVPAMKRLAELKGRECYFFTEARDKDGRFDFENMVRLSDKEAEKRFYYAYDVPSLDGLTKDERAEHYIYFNDISRTDPDLITVIDELGAGHRTGASGPLASLKIIEIPDDVEYLIDEYDGNEHIAEFHRTWS
jgi:hypothetical protein